MGNVGQMLAFGAGSMWLGVTATIAIILALAGRHERMDGSDSCMGTMVCSCTFVVALFFFYLAFVFG